MVDVFRPSGELLGVAQQAIAIGAKVLWAQLAIYDDAAAELAERAGLTVGHGSLPKNRIAQTGAIGGKLHRP